MAHCPTCGARVDESVASASERIDYEGVTYFFCCAHCQADFQRNPEKYVARKG